MFGIFGREYLHLFPQVCFGREYSEYLGYLEYFEENIGTLFHKSALVENEHLVVTHHSVQP